MRFENLFPIVFASLATAHFVLQLPTNINFDDATEDQAPCGGFSASDRTSGVSDLTVSGFGVGVVTTHSNVVWDIRAALVSDVTSFINLVPSISQQGTGNWCPLLVPGITAWIGQPVVLQIRQTGPDGVLYQCAAINFIGGGPGPVDEYCFNSTGVVASYIEGGTSSSTSVTPPPTSSTTSSTSSSSETPDHSHSHTPETSSSTTTTTTTSSDSHSHTHTTTSTISSTTTAGDSHSHSHTTVSSSTSSVYGNSTSTTSAHSHFGDGPGGSVTSTTIIETITSCPPTVTKCPLGQVTTKVIPVTVSKSSVVSGVIISITTSTKSAALVQFTSAATVLEARNMAVIFGSVFAAWFGMEI